MKFVEVLKDLMIEKEISIKELSAETGIKLGSIYFYFKNETLPDINCAIKLSEYFGCSINYLLGLDEKKDFVPKITNKTFIKIYEELLSQNNETNYKVCQKLDINRNSIYHWRKGKTPKMVNLIEMAKYFDVSIDFLLGRATD